MNLNSRTITVSYSLFLQSLAKSGKKDTEFKGDASKEIGKDTQNNFNQSRESFDEVALQNKELMIKRQFIEELRKKLNAMMDESRFLKGDMASGNDSRMMQDDQDIL